MSKEYHLGMDPRIRLTLDQLSSCQQLAGRHITFSVTLACPLKCEHCIVDAGPEKGYTTMPIRIAESYASQMPALAEYGITDISFTGGEPLLARRQVEVISEAAASVGIRTAVVTAAHWAATPESASTTVMRFQAIECWDVSFDVFHLKWVSFSHIRNAFEAIRAANRSFTLRFTTSDPPTDTDLRLFEDIQTLPDVTCVTQRVRPVGRAESHGQSSADRYNPWIKPCLTQGMVVRYDGTVAPCCLNMVESRKHPFQLGDARQRTLVDMHRDYMRKPLLQMIRAIGFGQLRDWLVEAGLDRLLPTKLPEEVCEICVVMLHDREIAEFLTRKVEEPENQLKIALIASRVLNEQDMLRHEVLTAERTGLSVQISFVDLILT